MTPPEIIYIEYTAEIGAELCACVASGMSLAQACAAEGISPTTAEGWLRDHENFRAIYEIAADERAFVIMQENLRIRRASSPVTVH